MISVYDATEKNYTHNGNVVIVPTKANVHNEDNGDFYLDLVCDVKYNDAIHNEDIIVAPTPQGRQPFRIRDVKKNKNRMTIRAYHVFYDSDNYVIQDSYAVNKSCDQALAYFNAATDTTSPFSTFSDVYGYYNMRTVRKSLHECVTDVIERWGGHLVRDNFRINVLEDISRDLGVTIEYKKNLLDMTAEYDWSEVATKILPVGKDGTLLDQIYVYSSVQYELPHSKVIEFDQDIEEEDYPDEASYKRALKADLLSQATEYVKTSCYPKVNYTLKGLPERVSDIGDVILVRDERIGVDITTQVMAYEYDAIMERYVSLEFGNYNNSLRSALKSFIKSVV